MNFESAFEYVLVAVSILAVCYLISLLVDYWYGDGGLRNGSLLLAVVAIVLVSFPSAGKLVVDLTSGTISFERDKNRLATIDNLKKEQLKVVSDNRALEKQNKELQERLDEMEVSVKLNSETLKKLPDNFVRVTAADEKISTLLAKQKAIYEKPKPNRWNYSIQFDNIQFNHICEKSNNTGEFYYTFLINGDPIVDVTVNNPVKVTEGQIVDLSHYRNTVIKSVSAEETFTLSGFVKEYDGRSFLGLGRSIKVTNVGEFTDEIRYDNNAPTIVVGGVNNTECKATLKLKVTKL